MLQGEFQYKSSSVRNERIVDCGMWNAQSAAMQSPPEVASCDYGPRMAFHA